MLSDTQFLQPTGSTSSSNPNFAQATGGISFFSYSQNASDFLTYAETNTLVNNGVSAAIAEAQALFLNDPAFSYIFSSVDGIGLDGTYQGSGKSTTKVVASFDVSANQTFSFNFAADTALTAKEIENPQAEYNQAKSKTAFLVLDVSNVNQPKVLDFFGMRGNLISSKEIGDLKLHSSRKITIDNCDRIIDIDGDNGTDSVIGTANGTYQRKFLQDKKIAIVEINESSVQFKGDTLIGNLGKDVTYGTICNDNLSGSDRADKIYGSLGKDRIQGKKGDDILEGGQGNDTLNGGQGNDKLYGSWDDDVLIGGRGNDILVGGDGEDTFVFEKGDSLLAGEYDIIKDFEVGIDKIQFLGWNSIAKMVDTQDGTLLTLNPGGKLLLEGLNISQLNPADFLFS
ncbi:calcium-binding protein [Calothrix sp. NIES-2098]|uniref:calcium-binding protein n=1 Tax=Calothrix sp. NIES-2098 TaxID=1954171 RepID=UPI000B5ECA0C|nr:hypothetical protein NIES2098_10770 [Calothrix sp. NIES-2098]